MMFEVLLPPLRRRMPLTVIGVFLALPLAPIPSTAAPQTDKDLAQQIFDTMVQFRFGSLLGMEGREAEVTQDWQEGRDDPKSRKNWGSRLLKKKLRERPA